MHLLNENAWINWAIDGLQRSQKTALNEFARLRMESAILYLRCAKSNLQAIERYGQLFAEEAA